MRNIIPHMLKVAYQTSQKSVSVCYCSTKIQYGSKPVPQRNIHEALPQKITRFEALNGIEDKFRGIHIDLKDLPENVLLKEFDKLLSATMLKWTQERKLSVWLTVPIQLSQLIPVAANHGFTFHHAENDSSTLCKWLREDRVNPIPRFATHQVGVAGCVIREDTNEVLVIQDRHRKTKVWKFPGGLSDLGEDFSATAKREVFEETGINTEYQGIITFRQQHDHPGAFGRSDIYFICYMKPLTFDINVDENEISRCTWMPISELAEDIETTAMTQRVVQLLQAGLKEGFQKVVLANDEFISVYKGHKYRLNHVDLGLPHLEPHRYKHSTYTQARLSEGKPVKSE